MMASRLLFRGNFGAALALCNEGKRMENLLGTGKQCVYMDNIIRSCMAVQRATGHVPWGLRPDLGVGIDR